MRWGRCLIAVLPWRIWTRKTWMVVTGSKKAVSPFMADASADGEDGGSIEKWGGVLLESAKDANNPVMH